MAVVVVKSITRNANPSDKKKKVDSAWGNTTVSFSSPSQSGILYSSESKAAELTPLIQKSNQAVMVVVPKPSSQKGQTIVKGQDYTPSQSDTNVVRRGSYLVKTGIRQEGERNYYFSPIIVEGGRKNKETFKTLPQEKFDAPISNVQQQVPMRGTSSIQDYNVSPTGDIYISRRQTGIRISGTGVSESPMRVNFFNEELNESGYRPPRIEYVTTYPDRIETRTVSNYEAVPDYSRFEPNNVPVQKNEPTRFYSRIDIGGSLASGRIKIVQGTSKQNWQYELNKLFLGEKNSVRSLLPDKDLPLPQSIKDSKVAGFVPNLIQSMRPSDIALSAFFAPAFTTSTQAMKSYTAQVNAAEPVNVVDIVKYNKKSDTFDIKRTVTQGTNKYVEVIKGKPQSINSKTTFQLSQAKTYPPNTNKVIQSDIIGESTMTGKGLRKIASGYDNVVVTQETGRGFVSESVRSVTKATEIKSVNLGTYKMYSIDKSNVFYSKLANTVRQNIGYTSTNTGGILDDAMINPIIKPRLQGVGDYGSASGIVWKTGTNQYTYVAQSGIKTTKPVLGGNLDKINIIGDVKITGGSGGGSRIIKLVGGSTKVVSNQALKTALGQVSSVQLVKPIISTGIPPIVPVSRTTQVMKPITTNENNYRLMTTVQSTKVLQEQEYQPVIPAPLTPQKTIQPERLKSGGGQMYAPSQMTTPINKQIEGMVTPFPKPQTQMQEQINPNFGSYGFYDNYGRPRGYGAGLLPFSSGIPQSYGGGLGISTKSKRTPSFGAVALKFNFGINVPKMSPFMESTGLSERAYTGNINLPNLEVKYWKKKRYLM